MASIETAIRYRYDDGLEFEITLDNGVPRDVEIVPKGNVLSAGELLRCAEQLSRVYWDRGAGAPKTCPEHGGYEETSSYGLLCPKCNPRPVTATAGADLVPALLASIEMAKSQKGEG